MPERSTKGQSRLLANLQREKSATEDRFQKADQALGVTPEDNKPRRKPGPKPSGKVRMRKLLSLAEEDYRLFDEIAQRCVKNRTLPPGDSEIASAALRVLARLDTSAFLKAIEDVKS